jgi:hypothetical protein
MEEVMLIPSPYTEEINFTATHSSTDNYEAVEKNKKRFGKEWYWYNNPIEYKYNNYGYRMNKNMEDVDFDNYFAFFGCSFTVGIGLQLDMTYPYRIAQKAKVDYINGGLAGSSPEFTFLNFTEMMNNVPKYPKHVIINWPEINRTLYWEKNQLTCMMHNYTKPSYWSSAYKDFLLEDSHIQNRFHVLVKSIRTTCKLANIKLFEFTTHQSDSSFERNHPGIRKIPLGRWMSINNYDAKNLHYALGRDIDVNGFTAHPGMDHQYEVETLFFKENPL